MIAKSKTLRYYYWLILEFAKKHMRMILLSFFLSFLVIVSLVSFSSYFNRFLFPRKEIVGLIGSYNYDNIPNEILEKVSHGLVFSNEKGQILPALASSWEMIDGGREFRFHLKNNLFWDDGKEFTTDDIVYNFRDIQTKVIDENTIHFISEKKLPTLPTFLVKPILRYPLHGVGGLYKADRIKIRQGTVREIVLSPNKQGLSLLVYRFYDTESKLVNAYKKGEITKMDLTKKNLADIFKTWKNTKISRSVDYSRVLTLFFNLKNPLLSQKDIRKTLSQALPREEFTEFGELASGPISPVSWAYNPQLKQTLGNPEAAEKSLKTYLEASPSANLRLETFYDYLNTANIVEDSFKTAGLHTTLRLSNFERPENFDLLLAFWELPEDPDQYFFWHSTQTQGNITGYENAKVDKLLEDGRSTLLVDERKKYYQEFQRVLADELPAVFIYYPYVYTVERK